MPGPRLVPKVITVIISHFRADLRDEQRVQQRHAGAGKFSINAYRNKQVEPDGQDTAGAGMDVFHRLDLLLSRPRRDQAVSRIRQAVDVVDARQQVYAADRPGPQRTTGAATLEGQACHCR